MPSSTSPSKGRLMWVSEWRIEPEDKSANEYGFYYKITNGGVYCSAGSEQEAKEKLKREIYDEMDCYRANQIKCPVCSKTMAEHQGERDYKHCLLNMSLLESQEISQ